MIQRRMALKKKNAIRDTMIRMRISKDLRDQLAQVAADEDRSISAVVRLAITKFLSSYAA